MVLDDTKEGFVAAASLVSYVIPFGIAEPFTLLQGLKENKAHMKQLAVLFLVFGFIAIIYTVLFQWFHTPTYALTTAIVASR